MTGAMFWIFTSEIMLTSSGSNVREVGELRPVARLGGIRIEDVRLPKGKEAR